MSLHHLDSLKYFDICQPENGSIKPQGSCTVLTKSSVLEFAFHLRMYSAVQAKLFVKTNMDHLKQVLYANAFHSGQKLKGHFSSNKLIQLVLDKKNCLRNENSAFETGLGKITKVNLYLLSKIYFQLLSKIILHSLENSMTWRESLICLPFICIVFCSKHFFTVVAL